MEAGKGHSDDLLRGPRMDELSEADKHLATALVMGVLRWQIALDAMIRRYLERPDQRIAESVALAMRLGAFQLLHMDRIPAHAALSESVELCRAAGQPHATGMVNAILRKVATSTPPKEKLFELPAAFAERLGHPSWMVDRWVKSYGLEAAKKVCAAGQQEPSRGGLFSAEEGLPEIDDGSRLVAEIAAAAVPLLENRVARVWDCCAAPGGKTLIMAARLPGAEILASDLSARRLTAMQGRFRRLPLAAGIKTAAIDAAKTPPGLGEFDLILCDVPCSGTGTLARNPEIRLRLHAYELTRQGERQAILLRSALRRLAPGGRLVYSTCSLEPEECEAVVAKAAAGYERIDVTHLVRKVPGLIFEGSLVSDGALRTLPGICPCDGFYAVVLERACM